MAAQPFPSFVLSQRPFNNYPFQRKVGAYWYDSKFQPFGAVGLTAQGRASKKLFFELGSEVILDVDAVIGWSSQEGRTQRTEKNSKCFH